MNKLTKYISTTLILNTGITYADLNIISPLEVQQQIQNDISIEMESVKQWLSLYNDVNLYFIDMSAYPKELQQYNTHQIDIIESYLNAVEIAESEFHQGGDYNSKIQDAKNILSKLTVIKQIFDEYVWYKNNEKSESFLLLNTQAVESNTIIPRMNRISYTVLRGEYPIEVIKKDGKTSRLDLYSFKYKNGDIAVFMNDFLIETTTASK